MRWAKVQPGEIGTPSVSAHSVALLFIKLGEQCGLILGLGYRHEHELESVASGVSDHDGVKRVVETQ